MKRVDFVGEKKKKKEGSPHLSHVEMCNKCPYFHFLIFILRVGRWLLLVSC